MAAVTRIVGPRYGRPSDRFGPPTALFDETLAILKYDLEHLEGLTPSPKSVDHAFDLVTTATNFFEKEEERGRSLRKHLDPLVGNVSWGASIAGGTTTPDGVCLEGPFAYLIFELKNEPGLGGDPFLQSLIVYGKNIEQKAVRHPSSYRCLSTKLPHSTTSLSHGQTYPSSC